MTEKVVASNRKARFDYHLLEFIEAGIVLQGSEIKSIRAGQISIAESYVEIDGKEAWLVDAHVAPYLQASIYGHEPRRKRKLLLSRMEIRKLWNEVRKKGVTIIPTKVYIKDGLAKVEIAIARGKKQYDKREAIAKREIEREIQRETRKINEQ